MNVKYIGPVHEVKPFDVTDDEMIQDLVGPSIAKPIHGLLMTLDQISLFENSFGLDKARAFDSLLPDLKELHRALKQKYVEEL